MALNYAVTIHRPTAVTHSVSGQFTGEADINLIIAKSTRLEVHRLTPEGLQPVIDANIYGRIAFMSLYRPAVRLSVTRCGWSRVICVVLMGMICVGS